MKRILAILCICGMLFSLVGCASAKQRFQYTYLDAFDTVTVLHLYADTQETADAWAGQLHAEMLRLHSMFTIYENADQFANLKTVNDASGQEISVTEEILSLLRLGKKAYTLTDGKVNMAMGSVLQLWHDARAASLEDPQNAYLPDAAALAAAAKHTDIDSVVLNETDSTVQLTDEEVALDVGAFAKGYAVQLLAEYAKELGVTSALISVGGNVVAIGDKAGQPFLIGVEDPADPQTHLLVVEAKDCAVVTSGNYQRYFTVDGVRYHHLIDPATMQPANYWASVTVLGPGSGMADVLSTALFLLPQAEGAALLETMSAYEAVWVSSEGNILYSDKEFFE